jgi:2'-5' RNA ligase
MTVYRELLQSKYDEIWKSARPFLLSNDLDLDPNLQHIESDERLGLTALIKIEGSCLTRLVQIMGQLQSIEPHPYYYPASDLHLTVLDFTVASEHFVLDRDRVEVYKKILSEIVRDSSFEIEFTGLTAGRAGVLAQGFHNGELQNLREALRGRIAEHGMALQERYKAMTAHSTIARFKQPLASAQEFVRTLEELRHLELGVMRVTRVLFVLHDWYNREEKTRVLGRYPLGQVSHAE